jgi:hypothetical protein
LNQYASTDWFIKFQISTRPDTHPALRVNIGISYPTWLSNGRRSNRGF